MNTVSKKLFSVLRLVIAAGMLYYLGSSGLIDWRSFTGLVEEWEFTLLALFMFIVGTFLQACRLHSLVNAHQLDLSLFAATRLTFIGLYFNAYLPGANGGDLVKIYYASKGNPGNRTKVTTILLYDRFIGLFTLLTLPLFVAPFFSELIAEKPVLQLLINTSFVITVTIIIVSIWGAKIDLANNRLMKWVQQNLIFGQTISRVLHTVHSYRDNMSAVFIALFYSYVLQILMVSVSLAVAHATNQAGADFKMTLLLPLGYLANALPITPGGLGVGEAALESLFTLGGLQGGAETLLGWRIMMIISGLIGLIFFLKGEKRFVYTVDDNQ